MTRAKKQAAEQVEETQAARVSYSVSATGSLLHSGRIYKPGEDVTGKICDERITQLVERGLVKAAAKIALETINNG